MGFKLYIYLSFAIIPLPTTICFHSCLPKFRSILQTSSSSQVFGSSLPISPMYSRVSNQSFDNMSSIACNCSFLKFERAIHLFSCWCALSETRSWIIQAYPNAGKLKVKNSSNLSKFGLFRSRFSSALIKQISITYSIGFSALFVICFKWHPPFSALCNSIWSNPWTRKIGVSWVSKTSV